MLHLYKELFYSDTEIKNFLNCSYQHWKTSFISTGFEFDIDKLTNIEGHPSALEEIKKLDNDEKLKKWETNSMAELSEYVVSQIINRVIYSKSGPSILLSGFVENWLGRLCPYEENSMKIFTMNVEDFDNVWSKLTGVNIEKLHEDLNIWFTETVDRATIITSIDCIVSDKMEDLKIPTQLKMKDLKKLKGKVKTSKIKQYSLSDIVAHLPTHEDNAELFKSWLKSECNISDDDMIQKENLINYIDSIFNTKIGLHGLEICDLFSVQELAKGKKHNITMEDILKYLKKQIIKTKYKSMKNNEFDFIYFSKVGHFRKLISPSILRKYSLLYFALGAGSLSTN